MNPVFESWEVDAKMLRELYRSALDNEGWPCTDLDIDRDMLLGYGASDPATEADIVRLKGLRGER